MKIRPMMQNRISSYVKNDLVNRNLTGFAEVQFGTQKQNSLVEAACGCGDASMNAQITVFFCSDESYAHSSNNEW